MKWDKFNQPYYDYKTAARLSKTSDSTVIEYVQQCSYILRELQHKIQLTQDLQKEINILQNENKFLKELLDDTTRSIE